MKKKIIIIGAVCLLVIILTVTVLLSLFMCSSDKFSYENEEKYRIGEFNQTLAISAVDVEWLWGKVEILYHYGSNFYCVETSETPINGDATMRYLFDGDVLSIKPCASGTRVDKVPEKNLSIYIPVGAAFNDIDIRTEGADVELYQVGATFFNVETTGGNIDIVHMGDSKNVKLISGSGDISYDHQAGKSTLTEIRSASGNLTLSEAFVSYKLKATTDSGNIELSIPESAKLTYDLESKSGISSNGGFENTFVGDDVSRVELTSNSGSVILKKR